MTPIADMVEQMLAATTPHATIVLAVRTAEASRHAVTLPSRSAGAVRSARYRANHKQIKVLAEANDAANTIIPQRHASRDGVTACCDLSFLLPVSENGIREVKKEKQTEIEAPAKPKVSRETRGTRMVAGALLSAEGRAFARDFANDSQIERAWLEFVDFWIGVPGQRGLKTNWEATWRNRVRAIFAKNGAGNERAGQTRSDRNAGPKPGQDAILTGVARYAARRFGTEPANSGGSVSGGPHAAGAADPNSGAARGNGSTHPLLELTAERDAGSVPRVGKGNTGDGDKAPDDAGRR